MGSKTKVSRFLSKPHYTSESEFLMSLNPISDVKLGLRSHNFP